MDREQHVVADFRGLTIADTASMDHGLTHCFEHRLGCLKGVDFSADHEGQRAGIRRRDAARNGCIDNLVAFCVCRIGNFARGGDIDGRTIDQRCGMRRVADNVAGVDRFYDGPVGQHGDNRFGVFHSIADIGEGFAASFLGAGQRILGQIERADVVPGFHKICGHPAAHIAEANKCDFHVSLLWGLGSIQD